MASFRLFRHYIPTPFIFLMAIEALIFYGSIYASAHLRFLGSIDPEFQIAQSIGDLQPRAWAFAVVMFLSMLAMGLYQAQRREGLSNVMLRVGVSYVIASVALALLFYMFPHLYFGRGVFLLAVFSSFFIIVALRSLFLNTVDRNVLKRRVLVYGAGRQAAMINDLRKSTDQFRVYVVGFVHVPGEHDVIESHKVIRLKIPLVQYVQEEQIDEIVVAINDRRKNYPLDELLDCRLSGVEVIEPVQFVERETGKLHIDLLHPSWMIFSDGFDRGSLRTSSERVFDIFASLLLLVMSAPLMLITALAIWFESYGKHPILYRQIRVGLDGEPIMLYKFRSMRVGAEKDGEPLWAQRGDARVTRVGVIIRKYHIDELPQLFNILAGDMSLIGPRPERPEFVQDLVKQIPFYAERHRVKPGLAGWAQLNYPYGCSQEDALQKLQYDLYYVKNHSLFLDFLILLQTAEVVLWGRGAR
ncbi:MAG: TIGR03013 family XrtA/PEP-CTERM system glycosyltransferase [Gammaproteobacteria bacterium]